MADIDELLKQFNKMTPAEQKDFLEKANSAKKPTVKGHTPSGPTALGDAFGS